MAARRAQTASASIVSSTFRSLIIALATVIIARPAHAAVFAYQGTLRSGGTPLNGTVDLRFRLYGVSAGGLPIGSVPVNAVSVVDGLFMVDLDFGASVFNGSDRWIEIDVASPANGGAGPFTTLTPRQRVGFAPMAQHALNASLSGTYASAVNFSNASNSFTGSGAGLTNLNAANLAGTIGSTLLSGSYANALTLSNPSNAISGSFTGNGSGLSSLNAAAIGSGNLSAARLPLSGQWLIDDPLRIDSSTLSIDPLNNRVGIGVMTPTHDLDVNGNMSVDGTTLNVDDVNNRVGVGTSLPQSRFHVVGSSRLEGQMTFDGAATLTGTLDVAGAVSVDASTFNVDVVNNRVGVGTTSPIARLHVVGSTRLEGQTTFDGSATFLNLPAVPDTTRYAAIPATAFIKSGIGESDIVATHIVYGDNEGVPYVFSAPIQLPHGATISNIALSVFDNSSTQNMSMFIESVDLVSGAYAELGNASTGGSSASLRVVNIPVSRVVNNNGEALNIRCQWTSPLSASLIYIAGARVTYTVDRPVP